MHADGWSKAGADGILRPRNNRNRNRVENFAPLAPAVEAPEIVGAHQPDEVDAGITALQGADQFDGPAAPQPGLYIADYHAWPVREGRHRRHAVVQLPGPSLLEWILRRDQPPDPVQAKAPSCGVGDVEVAVMGWIERTAEQTNFHPADERFTPQWRRGFRGADQPASRHRAGPAPRHHSRQLRQGSTGRCRRHEPVPMLAGIRAGLRFRQTGNRKSAAHRWRHSR